MSKYQELRAAYMATPDGSNASLNALAPLMAEVGRLRAKEFQPGDLVWWQARKGRVRTPQALPARIVRKLRTRYEVQVLSFTDHSRDHERWKPAPAELADLVSMDFPNG